MEQIHITLKEKQILELTFTGKQKKEVACIMGLQPSAIMWHMKKLHRKFSASTTTEVIYKALQQGILKAPDPS